MNASDLSHIIFRKATASASSNGGCVELATNLPTGYAAMRDSTRPAAGVHLTSSAALTALLADAKTGVYDI